MFIRSLFIKISIIGLFTVLLSNINYSQHRGDNLSFQGIYDRNDPGVKATAMGGAATTLSGNISALFYNPAGLSSINSIQFSVSANYYSNHWRENQRYRPNRYFVTLPFYLEGLYIPDPADNGLFDHERIWTEDQQIDTTYIVNLPQLGNDPFSEKAADWTKDKNNFALNNIAIAVPFNFDSHHFVASAAYNREFNVEDYDRNETYLDPHIGYDLYGDVPRVNGVDTLVVNWSQFLRYRSGSLNSVNAGIAYSISENLNVGVGLNVTWGETDDFQSLKLVGAFDLIRENRFRFSYLDTYYKVEGTSEYSSTNFNLGAIFKLEKFSFGIKVDLPYTIERKWNYTEFYQDSISSSTDPKNGIDEFDIPAIFNLGVNFKPVDNFLMAVDYEYAPYSETEFKLSEEDPTLREWADRHIIRFGLEYSPYDFLSLLGGYRNIPVPFIPDGAAVKDRGPDADSYTFGISLNILHGRFDFAYEIRVLKYYDSYYSNTNYVTENYSNLLFGYTFKL
ncbi:OmpP1/FadL family transporter [Bacteroidota bacterium]